MTRVIVIGNGMVGSRFAEELSDRDAQGRFAITVLGDEEHETYNRVLLSDFVAGKVTASSLLLPAATGPRTTVVRGCRVVAIDRVGRTVTSSDGRSRPYDILVMATGASARSLPLEGLGPDSSTPGAHVLRSLDDARGIVAATLNAKRAVVIGGGVLGLEAATGLARRGVLVTVVHGAGTLMERQLNGAASAVTVGALARAGVQCELSAASTGVVTEDGRIAGLVLADGRTIPCDLLLMSCGTIPNTAVAAGAGLTCDRGIVVGPDLASPDDPAVFAIGDCARPPEGGSGLIAQGWEQARRLALALLGRAGAGTPEPAGPTDVVRVKGAGLDIVAMGPGPAASSDPRLRAVVLSDPAAGRHIEAVVDGDRLVAATCVGAGPVAADLVAAYTRGTPLPRDPAYLLLRPGSAAAPQTGTPTTMPDRFTVCRCNGVTKRDIMKAWSAGARTAPEVAAATRATTGCGGCSDVVCGILDWMRAADPDPEPSQAAAPAGAPDVILPKHRPHGAETSAR